jgi:hypothetical protein
MESGKLYALCGASRSGKTQKALDLIRGKTHGLIWDVEGQYQADIRITNQKELARVIFSSVGKRGIIAYTGRLEDFDFFCKLAFWYVRAQFSQNIRTFVVFEETADVTSPGKAPEDYGILLRRGLKYGVDLIAITQRPAESDKTAMGNASMIHVCRMSLPRDRTYMANTTGISIKEIEKLRADQDAGLFDYFTVDIGRGKYLRGELSFKRNKPVFSEKTGWQPI